MYVYIYTRTYAVFALNSIRERETRVSGTVLTFSLADYNGEETYFL